MERYLLFDARCLTCSSIAKSIEDSTNGWVKVRSLYESEMQTLLSRTRPHWKWEPTLLELDGDRIHSYTGFALRKKFLLELGPTRTWRTISGVHKAISRQAEAKISRRRFFARSMAVLGGMLIGIGWTDLLSNPTAQADSSMSPSNTLTTSHLASDTARTRLASSPTFREVRNHLGEPNWDQVYAYQYTNRPEKGIVSIYPSEENTVTFLAIDDPQPEKHTVALIGKFKHKNANLSELAWHTHKGELVATQVFQNGKTTIIPSAQQPLNPDFSLSCFILCIGRNVDADCANNCIFCALNPIINFGSCVICALCAGPKGVSCAKECNY